MKHINDQTNMLSEKYYTNVCGTLQVINIYKINIFTFSRFIYIYTIRIRNFFNCIPESNFRTFTFD